MKFRSLRHTFPREWLGIVGKKGMGEAWGPWLGKDNCRIVKIIYIWRYVYFLLKSYEKNY